MAYEIIWESPSGVVKRHFGHVTGGDLRAAVEATESDPRFNGLRYVINDFLDCRSLAVADPEVEEIAAIDNAAALSNNRIRIAVVATLPEVIAVARVYAHDPLTPYETRICDTMAAARDWLGAPG